MVTKPLNVETSNVGIPNNHSTVSTSHMLNHQGIVDLKQQSVRLEVFEMLGLVNVWCRPDINP
ncbi:hypothetical protein BPOR_0570g00040 [Botrytis porri]|uniref:Uncharacterized protein n=1 Tax=Botrytis porri TaxID=87229 RepID=A0A4Z1KQT3_9HELO|nr:hypothetical protein BPOR_0570g00040 [Botrytis porri]